MLSRVQISALLLFLTHTLVLSLPSFLASSLLSPLWVWLMFGEALPPWTIAGGLLLLATLAVHELAVHRMQEADASGATRATASAPATALVLTVHTSQQPSAESAEAV